MSENMKAYLAHEREAKRLLSFAVDDAGGSSEERYHLAAAQVYATLAVAAATAAQVAGTEVSA